MPRASATCPGPLFMPTSPLFFPSWALANVQAEQLQCYPPPASLYPSLPSPVRCISETSSLLYPQDRAGARGEHLKRLSQLRLRNLHPSSPLRPKPQLEASS